MPLEDRWDAEAVLAIRATLRRPTPSTNDGVIRALVLGEDAEPKEPRDMRSEVFERRLAAQRDADSGAGLPRPEANDRNEYADARRFRITEAMVLKYGLSDDCQGCDKRALGEK